ncbi:nucleotidyltransferase family protein [Gordonia sp. CPCC 205333]|uniref:nucleotidyltransferase family protein n=1 Tax=Gordonia sp. CPCC 205333 TaxID=3140790 RepID=UPI003AF3D72A
MTVVGILLAAGAGRRYGMPKVLAEQGRWLSNSVTALDVGGCDGVIVALGAALVDVPEPATAHYVADWSQGIGVTLRAVLTAARGPDVDGVLIHLVDLPDVDHRVVARVLEVAQAGRDILARATFGGRPGHPVYLGAAHFDAVLDGLSGDVGAGPYLAERGDIDHVECAQFATGVDCDVPSPKRKRG